MGETQLEWAVNEVRKCRRISLPLYKKGGLAVERKTDNSPVTVADVRIEDRLRSVLIRRYAGDSVIGEEHENPETIPQTYWTVDPIDGTRAFSRGLPFWGTLLGRVERGRATVGVCDYPALNMTLFGSAAVGTFIREGNRVRKLEAPQGRRPLSEAVILHGGSRWWRGTSFAKGFDEIVQRCYLERAFGDCYGYLWLFKGLADAVIECGLARWDIVPLAALARPLGLDVYGPHAERRFDGAFSVAGKPCLARELALTLSGKHRK